MLIFREGVIWVEDKARLAPLHPLPLLQLDCRALLTAVFAELYHRGFENVALCMRGCFFFGGGGGGFL